MEYHIERIEKLVVAIQAESEEEALDLVQDEGCDKIVLSRKIQELHDTVVGSSDFTRKERRDHVDNFIAKEKELLESGDDWALEELRACPVFPVKREI